MGVVVVLSWIFTVLLLVLVVVSLLARSGTLPANHWAGIRVRALTRSEAAWRAGHGAAVTPALVAFVVSLVFAVIGVFAPAACWGSVVAFVGGLIWVGIRATRAADAVSNMQS